MRKLFRLFAQYLSRNREMALASEFADAIHRLADVGELIAGGLFAIAAGEHTTTLGNQRNMAAVFMADALERYGDVLKKLDTVQKKQLDDFVQGLCKGKR